MIIERWINPRRKRFWAVVAVLFYTLFGFFAAPLIIEKLAIDFVQEDLGRTAVIKKVEVNPYVMSLRVLGFEIDDSDGVKLAAFEEFFVNFQLSSLFNRAWTFAEIRLANSYFFFERFDPQSSRLSNFLKDLSKDQEAEVRKDDQGGAPRLLIHNLTLSEGRIDVKDNVPETVVETSLAPINISIQELNTLPDRHGEQSVTIRLPGNATLKWAGSLTLAPLDSEGELELESLQLDMIIAYLKGLLPLESIAINMSSRFHYRIHMQQNGQLDAEIDEMEVEFVDIALAGLAPETDFLSVAKIALSGGVMRYPEQSLQFGSLRIDQPRLTAWLDENRKLSLAQLVPASKDGMTPTKLDKQSSPWQLGLGELIIEGGSLNLSDQSIQPAAMVDVSSLQFKLSDISSQGEALFPLELSATLPEGGSFNVDGSLGVFPEISFAGSFRTKDVPLSLGQTHAQQYARIKLEAGVLDSDIEINMPAGQAITAAGAIQVSRLEVNDSIANERLLGWDKLDIDHFEWDAGAGKLHLSKMLFEQLFGRIVVHEDQSTNLSALVIEQAEDPAGTSANSFGIIIGGIRVDDGSMDFSDLSLPLPFATHVTKLNGTISTIDTGSNAPANIRLEGQVDEYGLARIDGAINILDPIQKTDVTVEFRNLLMSGLSPYTAQFAGHEIAEGKLGLKLNYAISDGTLHGENNIVMSDLMLGEKVDHPDAASLPLGLAVALLKDADGVINIDLPVEGDINDPEFELGGVISKAIAGMITKIVSAPFRLLGNLIGIDSEDLGQFEFLAGRSDLTPPELEKVVQLEKALQERPELRVEISGVTDPAIDIPALRFIRLRALAIERLGEDFAGNDRHSLLLDVNIRKLLEILFSERNSDIPLESVKTKHMHPPVDDPEAKPVLDDLAYATDLWERLLSSEVISNQDLTALAQARATAISTAFLASGEFNENRVVIAEPKEVESEDGEWVKLELGVVAD
jgi:hypothetical protein